MCECLGDTCARTVDRRPLWRSSIELSSTLRPDDILAWKFPSDDLKLGSQFVVNQSQDAVFLKGGRVFDLSGPGRHTLSTANLPLLSAVVNLPFGNETPFAAEIWFVNKTVKRDLKWGTSARIPLIDPVYE
jgi:membrane protease subunit (stomatin/prohibitin family)